MKLKIYLSLLILATLSIAASAQPRKAGEMINWNEKTHNFSEIEQNAKAAFDFKFTNTTDAPIKLSKVKASCGCTTPKWTRDEIAPGESGTITVSYNTSRVGPFNKSIRIWVDTLPDPDLIYIKGKVNASTPTFQKAEGNTINGSGVIANPIKTEPVKKDPNEAAMLLKYKVPRGALRFEQVQQNVPKINSNSSETVEFGFYNATDKPITWNQQKIETQPFMKVEFQDVIIKPKSESKIKVTFDGTKYDGDDGYFSQRVRVYTDEPGKDNVKQLNVNGNFKKVYTEEEKANSPKIVFELRTINGGKIIEGEKFVYDFKFKNEGKSPLEIKSAKASCGCTATSPKDEKVDAGQDSYITATFDSRGRLGKQSKSVTVKSNDLSSPSVTLKFTVEVVKDPFHAGGMMGSGK